MSTNTYTIEKRSINIQPFQKDQPKKEEPTHKPFAEGTNYTVETTNPEVFSFGISSNTLDFGKLTATNPVIRNLNLSISSFFSYQILIAADHPLRKNATEAIPDTTCDNGSCSEITASLWTNTLTYGFGYHGEDMENGNFKQFADRSRNESFQSVFEGLKAKRDELTLTSKVAISAMQEKGSYSNTLSFIATPNY